MNWYLIATKVTAFVLLAVLANMGVSWLVDRLEPQIWPEHLEIIDLTIVVAVALYLALMTMPFLPGIEVGLILMAVLGPRGILIVYLCTLVALTTSFVIGAFVPSSALGTLLRWLGLKRAAGLVEDIDGVSPEHRAAFLAERTATSTVPMLLKNRYLVLALLLNLPGNALLGGGGGIAMMAGMSRLYSFPKYLLLLSIAVLPGPVLFLLSNAAV